MQDQRRAFVRGETASERYGQSVGVEYFLCGFDFLLSCAPAQPLTTYPVARPGNQTLPTALVCAPELAGWN